MSCAYAFRASTHPNPAIFLQVDPRECPNPVKVGVKPAAKALWGGYHGCFADPDGLLWEVAWNPDFWVE
jgi:hypothetical protein